MLMNPEPLAFVPTLPRLFPEAKAALSAPLFSHRTEMFDTLFRDTLKQLQKLCGNTEYQAIMCAGTGTLANDIMVWNYAVNCVEPLVISNGEFGTRLAHQCRMCNPNTRFLNLPWGAPITEDEVRKAIHAYPKIDTLLAVANESSCAQMLDIRQIESFHLPILLDGVSAVGVQQDFFQSPYVRCVTGSSGKALAALPGISILFYKDAPQPSSRRAITVDMVSLIDSLHSLGGVRNTFGSLQLSVLNASLTSLLRQGIPAYAQHLNSLKSQIIRGFDQHGIEQFPHSTSPILTAFKRPPDWDLFRDRWEKVGIDVYQHPSYLKKNNLFEIATMGDFTEREVERLLSIF